MIISVLSGKGGTGKTLISTNLAAVTPKATYLDCDVEEPNGRLFFKPEKVENEAVAVKIPEINHELCTGCRKCIDFCRFNALAYIKDEVIVFDELCHSCGGCSLLCPEKAISEKDKIIGRIEKGFSEGVEIASGILNIGEVSGVPIIKQLLNLHKDKKDLVVIDCPPGSACIVMESIKDSDYCVLVAEPSAFGVHNLNMVYELVKLFSIPFGVVLNKCTEEENPAEKFCLEKGIPIIGRIPFERKLGNINSEARLVVREDEGLKRYFTSIMETLMKEVGHETAINS